MSSGPSRAITIVYVGMLTMLACLPVVTLFAALRAGTIVIAEADQTDIGPRFWVAFRSHLLACTRIQVVWMAAVGLAVFDIVLAVLATSPLRSAVAVAGATVLVTALALVPHLILSSSHTRTLRDVVGAAVVRAGRQPAVTMALTVLTLVMTGMATALPLGIPLYLGTWSTICVLVVQHGDAAAAQRTGQVGGELA